jgi:CheY-like chemotaxis protein
MQPVIINETNPHVRDALRGYLHDCGFTVFLARNGQEAVGYASCTPVQLVMLDLIQPRDTAYEFCALIRRLPGYELVPILLAGFLDTAVIELAAAARATRVLAKPMSIDDLTRETEDFLFDPDDRPVRRHGWRGRAGAGLAETQAPLFPPQVARRSHVSLEAGSRALAVVRQSAALPRPRKRGWPHRD